MRRRGFPLMLGHAYGERHRKAHPSALADLVPDGRAAAGHRARDQAGGRGLLADERRRFRASLLRGPRGARVARHRAEGRQARRRLLRGRELLAAAGELLPAGDRVHGRRARRPADGAVPARRRVRLRRAAAARASAALVGQALAARRARAALASRSPSPPARRARAVAAAVEDRDGDLPPQDDRVRLLHDRPRREEKRKVDPYHLLFQRRAVLPDRPTRTSATTCASSGSRGSAARSATRRRRSTTSSRPRTSTRAPTRPAPTGSSASRWAPRGSGSPIASTGSSRATSATPATVPRPTTPGVVFETEYADPRAADRLGARPWRPARASWGRPSWPRSARAARAGRRAPRRHARARQPKRAAAGRPSPRRTPAKRERVADPARSASPGWSPSPGILIDAAREATSSSVAELCERLQVTEQELREDIDVLNVVNFGGGSYVLYAEVAGRPDRGRPRALRRQLRPPGAAAAARGEGAGRGDRPDRRPPARGLARVRAREDRGRARPGPGRRRPADHDREGRRLRDRARGVAARSPSGGC